LPWSAPLFFGTTVYAFEGVANGASARWAPSLLCRPPLSLYRHRAAATAPPPLPPLVRCKMMEPFLIADIAKQC